MAIGDIVSTLFGNDKPTPGQPLPTLTPESIKRKRLMAEALMKQGMDTSPIDSPWQGAARLANAFVGGLQNRKLDSEERRTTAAGQALFDSFAGGGAAPAAAPAAVAGDAPAVGSGSAPGGGLPADRIKMAGDYFTAQGYQPHQVAGIVGNLMQESGLNTGARNPGDGRDGSDSIGIAQWNGPRARAFQQFAAANNSDPKDFNTQLAFVNHELGTTESRVAQALKAAKNPAEATAAFVGYERPAGWSAANPAGAHGFDRRVGYANRAAGLLGMGADAPAVAANAAPVQVASADPSFVPQMPPQGAGQPPQAPAPQQMAQAPQQAPQAPPDPTVDAGNPMPPQAVQQAVQAASSPQVLQVAQAHAATPQGQQLVQSASGATVQNLMRAMAHPGVTDQQRAVLSVILKQKISEADPLHQAQLAEARRKAIDGPLETQGKQLANAEAQQRLSGGSPLDIRTKTAAALKAERELEGEGATPLSPQERTAYGIPAEQPAYKTRDGQIKFGPAGTKVNIDQRAQTELEKQQGSGLGKRLNDVADEGAKAQEDAVTYARFGKLLENVKTGKLTQTLEAVRQMTGVALDPKTDDVQALNAAIQYLAPRLRVPGSGAQSDRELGNFMASIPSLAGTPGGNQKIMDTLKGMIDYKGQRAEIAQQWQTGEITGKDATKRINELKSPFHVMAEKKAEAAKSSDPLGIR